MTAVSWHVRPCHYRSQLFYPQIVRGAGQGTQVLGMCVASDGTSQSGGCLNPACTAAAQNTNTTIACRLENGSVRATRARASSRQEHEPARDKSTSQLLLLSQASAGWARVPAQRPANSHTPTQHRPRLGAPQNRRALGQKTHPTAKRLSAIADVEIARAARQVES